MGELFREVCQELKIDIQILVGDLEIGVTKAVELEEAGIDVIISRGGTAIAIENKVVDVPVVGVNVSGFDLIRTIYKAREKTNKIAVVGFDPFTSGIKQLGDIMNIDLKIITISQEYFKHPRYIEKKLLKIKEKGYDWLVGDNISVKIAKKIGMNALLIRSGKESFAQAIKKAEEIAEVRKREKKKAQQNKCIVDFAYEGIISINQEGIITTFNPAAENILAQKAYKVIGQDISEILPEFDFKSYIKSKKREQGKIITLNELKIAVNIIPIQINGDVSTVIITFQKISNIRKVERKLRQEILLKGYTAANNFEDIIGQTPILQSLIAEAKDYAQVDLPLLIYGETGTGKELFAQSIHNHSYRREKPFVAFNCAALPEKLIESELFGYVSGAFTGASKAGKKGLLEQGNEGTIFLDEIQEVPLKLQARLLRFLQERKIRKIGDNKLTPVDVRIILATNKDIDHLVEKNKFRRDFYYRINVLNLNLPPLRNRKDDIPLLVNIFIRKINNRVNKNIKGISKDGIKILKSYDWPGNVRQLENIIEKLVIRTKTNYILTDVVRKAINSLLINNNISNTKLAQKPDDYKASSKLHMKNIRIDLTAELSVIEKQIIQQVLLEEENNKSAAAARLGISRTTLWRKLKD